MTANPPPAVLCRENEDVPEFPYSEYMVRWFELCQGHPYLATICNFPMSEPIPPAPMKQAELLALVGSLRNDTHRAILLDLLLDMLTPALIELVTELKRRGEI